MNFISVTIGYLGIPLWESNKNLLRNCSRINNFLFQNFQYYIPTLERKPNKKVLQSNTIKQLVFVQMSNKMSCKYNESFITRSIERLGLRPMKNDTMM